MKLGPTRASVFSAAILVLTLQAQAHHGFGRFDRSGEIDVEGILTRLNFVNPHSYVYFNVEQADGSIVEMGCEMRAATVLRRSGWSPELFVEGVRIRINGRPHRDDPTSCYVETLALGDAPALERYQQLSENDPRDGTDRLVRLPSGEPNLNGDWAQEQYLLANLPDGNARLVPKSMVEGIEAGTIAPDDVPDSGWGARPVTLTQPGLAAQEALQQLSPAENPNLNSSPTSILHDWVFDGPINRITQTAETVMLEYGRGLTRTVHLNMSAHPAGVERSRSGHSIGHWDGDTLVVDTVAFEPGSVARGVPHSDQLHVAERFTLDPESFVLLREFAADDPLYFSDQYVGRDEVQPADAEFALDECRELAFEYVTPEGELRR
jgi:hypothetical protein